MTSRTEYCTQTPNKPSLFDVQYLRNHRTLDIGVLGYIGIVWPKEHSPEVRSFPPGTPCIVNSWCAVRKTLSFHTVSIRRAKYINKCGQQVCYKTFTDPDLTFTSPDRPKLQTEDSTRPEHFRAGMSNWGSPEGHMGHICVVKRATHDN